MRESRRAERVARFGTSDAVPSARDVSDAVSERLFGAVLKASDDLIARALSESGGSRSAWSSWASGRKGGGSTAWNLDVCEDVADRTERAWRKAVARHGEKDDRSLKAELRMLSAFVQEATVNVVAGLGDVSTPNQGLFPAYSAGVWLRRAEGVVEELGG